MTRDTQERFIRNQLAGLAALGLDDEALTREETLLRTGFAQSALLSRLFALNGEANAPFGAKRLEGGDAVAHSPLAGVGCEGRGGYP